MKLFDEIQPQITILTYFTNFNMVIYYNFGKKTSTCPGAVLFVPTDVARTRRDT